MQDLLAAEEHTPEYHHRRKRGEERPDPVEGDPCGDERHLLCRHGRPRTAGHVEPAMMAEIGGTSRAAARSGCLTGGHASRSYREALHGPKVLRPVTIEVR